MARTGHQDDDDAVDAAAALNTFHHSPECTNPPSQGSNINCDEIYISYWDDDELVILEDGLVRYASEESIVKCYEKISYDLVSKTVRDVALRCRLISKRESSKRNKDRRKESGFNSASPGMPRFTFTSEPIDHLMASSSHTNPAAGISCKPSTGLKDQLIAANMLAFNKIRSDLATVQTREEADRLHQTSANILTTLHILSRDQEPQPPLPFTYEEHDSDTSSSDPELSRITSNSRASTSYSTSSISEEQGKTAGRESTEALGPVDSAFMRAPWPNIWVLCWPQSPDNSASQWLAPTFCLYICFVRNCQTDETTHPK